MKHETQSVLGATPPVDSEFCIRCGSDLEWVDCWQCGGEGATLPGDLYEEDPLWYAPDDTEPCHICLGRGGWQLCANRCDEKPAGISDETGEQK
jgi:hypothetical protein